MGPSSITRWLPLFFLAICALPGCSKKKSSSSSTPDASGSVASGGGGAASSGTVATFTTYQDPTTTSLALLGGSSNVSLYALEDGQKSPQQLSSSAGITTDPSTGEITAKVTLPAGTRSVEVKVTAANGSILSVALPAVDGASSLINASTTVETALAEALQQQNASLALPLPFSDMLKTAASLDPTKAAEIATAAATLFSGMQTEAAAAKAQGISTTDYADLNGSIAAAAFDAGAVKAALAAAGGKASAASLSMMIAGAQIAAQTDGAAIKFSTNDLAGPAVAAVGDTGAEQQFGYLSAEVGLAQAGSSLTAAQQTSYLAAMEAVVDAAVASGNATQIAAITKPTTDPDNPLHAALIAVGVASVPSATESSVMADAAITAWVSDAKAEAAGSGTLAEALDALPAAVAAAVSDAGVDSTQAPSIAAAIQTQLDGMARAIFGNTSGAVTDPTKLANAFAPAAILTPPSNNNPPAGTSPASTGLPTVSLSMKSPQAGACFSMQATISATSTSALTFTLQTTTGSGTFYSDSGCTQSTTSGTIAAGAGSTTVYYKDHKVEAFTVSATANSISTPASGSTTGYSLEIGQGSGNPCASIDMYFTLDSSATEMPSLTTITLTQNWLSVGANPEVVFYPTLSDCTAQTNPLTTVSTVTGGGTNTTTLQVNAGSSGPATTYIRMAGQEGSTSIGIAYSNTTMQGTASGTIDVQ